MLLKRILSLFKNEEIMLEHYYVAIKDIFGITDEIKHLAPVSRYKLYDFNHPISDFLIKYLRRYNLELI